MKNYLIKLGVVILGVICTCIFVFNKNYYFNKKEEVKDYSEFVGKTNECSLEDYCGFCEYIFYKYFKVTIKGEISEIDREKQYVFLSDEQDSEVEVLVWSEKQFDNYEVGDVVFVIGEMMIFSGERYEKYGLYFNGDDDGIYKKYEYDDYIYSVDEYTNLCKELYKDTIFVVSGTLIDRSGIYYLQGNGDTTFNVRLSSNDKTLDEYLNKEVKIQGNYHRFMDSVGLSNVKVIED